MNKIFKVIWNNAKHCYVVASELAKSYSKSNSSRTIRKSIAALGIAVAVYVTSGSAIAENSGGYSDPNTGDYTGNSQSNYTVTIDTDVTGNIYGRRSVSGKDAEKASVTITNGIVSKNVYGGYVELEDADVSSNSVTIKGGTIDGSVFGGYMETAYGETSSNSITISDGTVNDSVFGGMSYADNVTSNSVSISGGTIKGDVFGGSSGSGDATSNSVTISGGNLCGLVYGGYSESGNAVENSLNISSGTFGRLYGGFVNDGSGDVSSNSVNIIDGSFDSVYGGYVNDGSGNATSNSVNISSGTIKFAVEGGCSGSGDSVNNSVTISGGKIIGNLDQPSAVHGGISTSGRAVDNSVTIKNGTVDFVYGGDSDSGDAISNSVTISGGTVNGFVYGGFSFSSKAASNNIIISDGTIKGDIFGGSSGSGDATSNSVTISGGNLGENVFGGYSRLGNATSNSVTISGGNLGGLVYGGYSESGNAVENSLNISSGTFLCLYGGYVYDGSGDASSNSVTISDGSIDSIFVGYVNAGSGDASSNSAIINDGTISSVHGGIVVRGNGDAYGNSVTINRGKIGSYLVGGEVEEGIGDAINNSVTINGGTVIYYVYGGYVSNEGIGNADSNSVTINGGKVVEGLIYGGYSYFKDVTRNFININEGSFDSKTNIYAGYIYEPNNSTISDNSVNLGSNVTGLDNAEVYGYYFESGSGTHSGNELHIGRTVDYDGEGNIQRDSKGNIKYKSDSSTIWHGKSSDGSVNNSIKKVANFDTLALHSVAWDNDLPAIKAAALENIGTVDITDLKFYDNGNQKTAFEAGDSMTLLAWENEGEGLTNLKYKLNGTGDEQTAAFADNPDGIAVKSVLISETDKGISFVGTDAGNVKKVEKALQYTYNGIIMNSVDLSDWDGENAVSVPVNWIINDGVTIETDVMNNQPDSDSEKQILILKSDEKGFFGNFVINGENIYGKKQFTDSDEAERVVLTLTQEKGVTFDSDKTNIIYKVGSKDVTSFKLNTIAWEQGAELLSRDTYNYTKLTSLDTKEFNIVFEKPETVAANQSMTLLKANETLADMAAKDNSVSYQHEPVSGVTLDAVIRSSLEAKGGKVTLKTLSNKADKLTFGDVEWLDKGALIDHKTMLTNVSFDGAAVDTSKIAFTNRQKLDANSQMILVSDFDGNPGTITGTKYKVGTAYEGEGSAYIDGNDLVFKTKTGAGLSDETHATLMAMEAGVALVAAGSEHVGNAIEGLRASANAGADGVSTYASVGGASSRYKTGSHVDTNSWNCTLAVGKNLEKKDGTMEYGLFAEYGRGNYTLHMGGVEDAGSGNAHYTGGGLLLKWTNKHDVYTEASFRMGNMKDKASSLLHDGAGNAYGYDTSAKYRGGHFGIGKICREEDGTKLEIFGKYFYNEREGINFAAGADQYSLEEVRSRVLRAGFRLSSTDKKWNRYGGISYDYEFGGEAKGTVNGQAVRSASIKGGTLRGEFGYCREATKTNPWKTDITLYGTTGKRNSFGGSVAVEYHF